MNYMRSQLVNPVLTNYLVPRDQRFKTEALDQHPSNSESYWGKKSEKTTNTSEMPHISSNLESPEPYSIDHSVREDSRRFDHFDSQNASNYYESKGPLKLRKKKEKTFKVEDYGLIDYHSPREDLRTSHPSFENSNRTLSQSKYAKPNSRRNKFFEHEIGRITDHRPGNSRNHKRRYDKQSFAYQRDFGRNKFHNSSKM